MIKLISFISLIYLVSAADQDKQCRDFDEVHKKCGYDPNQPDSNLCQRYVQHPQIEQICVLSCLYMGENGMCGGSGDRCYQYHYSDEKKICILPCEFLGPNGCGDDPTGKRCLSYKKNQKGDACINDCTIYDGGCGGLASYECRYDYEQDPSDMYNKCRLKCSIIGDNNFCGGDKIRCKDYESANDRNFCRMKCTIFQNNTCGDEVLCSDFIQDPDNPNKCIHGCEQFGSLGCGNNNNNCSNFQKILNINKCQRNCTSFGYSSCGDDIDRCSDFIKVLDKRFECVSKCTLFGQKSCGDDSQKCSEYKKDSDSNQCLNCVKNDSWTDSQCETCFGVFSSAQFDKKDCINKSFTSLLSFSILLLAIIF